MWVTWLSLAVAVAVLPLGTDGGRRVGALAQHGRLRDPPRRGRDRTAVSLPVLAMSATAALVTVVAVVLGVALALAAGALLGLLALLARDLTRRRTETAARRALLAAVHVVIGELETGATPAAALAAAAGISTLATAWLGPVAAVAAGGGDAGGELRRAADPALRAIGLAWGVGDITGAALSGMLGRVAADLAAAEEQRRAVAVLLAGPRSSAAVLSVLPALGILLGMAMGARPLPFLLHSSPGHAVCCAGVLLDAAGLLWMRGLLRRAESTC